MRRLGLAGICVLFAFTVLQINLLASMKAPLLETRPSGDSRLWRRTPTYIGSGSRVGVNTSFRSPANVLKLQRGEEIENVTDTCTVSTMSNRQFILHACGSDTLSLNRTLDCVHELSAVLRSFPEDSHLEKALLDFHSKYQKEQSDMKSRIADSEWQLQEKQQEVTRLSVLLREKTEELAQLQDSQAVAYLCVSSLVHSPFWGLLLTLALQWYLWPVCLCCTCCCCYCLDQFGWVAKR